MVLAAEGRDEPCPESHCVYWENGCILAAADTELRTRPEVAALLLGLRRQLERARAANSEGELADFHRRLAAGRE
jgi:hypothetical protein